MSYIPRRSRKLVFSHFNISPKQSVKTFHRERGKKEVRDRNDLLHPIRDSRGICIRINPRNKRNHNVNTRWHPGWSPDIPIRHPSGLSNPLHLRSQCNSLCPDAFVSSSMFTIQNSCSCSNSSAVTNCDYVLQSWVAFFNEGDCGVEYGRSGTGSLAARNDESVRVNYISSALIYLEKSCTSENMYTYIYVRNYYELFLWE